MAQLTTDAAPASAPTQAPTRGRKGRMLHPVPPAPGWRDEVGALRDVGDELAVSLWRALRNVRMWAETEPERRGRLFNLPTAATQENIGNACARAPQLVEAFGTFAFLLRAPDRITGERVAEACHQVCAWAESRSLLLTAMHFAEAAAIVQPENPALANEAAWVCRRAARYDRAAIWYQRGYGLAMRMKSTNLTVSRKESIAALLGRGILMQFLGRHDEARAQYEHAARKAVQYGRRRQAAEAYHDLLTFAAEAGGTYLTGLEYATKALELYPINAPQIPSLAHDWAFILVRLHYYLHAVPILKLALARIQSPSLKGLFSGTLARAAAGAGRNDLADEARQIALAYIEVSDEYAPAVLVNLAEAARRTECWERAHHYAQMAVESARSRKTKEPERIALDLLEIIANRQPASPQAQPADCDRLLLLNRRFIARLQQWKASGSQEPEADPVSAPALQALSSQSRR